MKFGERIEAALAEMGWGPKDLELRTSVADSTISALTRRNSDRSNYKEELVQGFPADRISHEWLRNGTGKMIPDSPWRELTPEDENPYSFVPESMRPTTWELTFAEEVHRIQQDDEPSNKTERLQWAEMAYKKPPVFSRGAFFKGFQEEHEIRFSMKQDEFGSAHVAREPQKQYGSTLTPILAWEHEDDLPQGEYVFIPRLDIHLSAGDGREQVELEFVKKQPQAFRADWIRLEKLNPSKLACMKVDGESMEPLLYHGETVVIDVSQNTVRDGKVYALWYDGGERVKRLWKLPGGGLRIKSDNPSHPTIEVAPEHVETVRVLGRVVHKSGTGGL